MELVLKLSKESRNAPAMNFEDETFKKIAYVRYADD